MKTLTRQPQPETKFLSYEEEAARWRSQYFTDLVREDIFELGRLHEVRSMRLLLEMLRSRVGSPLSYTSLAEDIQVAPNTVKRYVGILEALYVIFLVRPFHRLIARSILKETKAYFYDSGFVKGDAGNRFENTCAQALLKHVHYLHDVKGKDVELSYLRTKEGREVDFALTEGERISVLVEAKTSEPEPSPSLVYFKERIDGINAVQLVSNLRRETHRRGVDIVRAAEWLSRLEA